MRRGHVLAIAAATGLASLLLVPVERLVPLVAPPLAVRALALIQPALLTALALAVGRALAPRLGLATPLVDARLAGVPAGPILRRQLAAAIPVGLGVAILLVVYSWLVTPIMTGGTGPAAALVTFRVPLIARILYGGIVEEMLARWGLVSLFAWALWRLRGRPGRISGRLVWPAIVVAALLFGVGHLPILSLVVPHPPGWLIAAVIVGNTLPGILFGWLFWRRGLEAAMIAHALAHLAAAPVT